MGEAKPSCFSTNKQETLECDTCDWYTSCDASNERPLCKYCNGSGEGQTGSALCYHCKGRGTK